MNLILDSHQSLSSVSVRILHIIPNMGGSYIYNTKFAVMRYRLIEGGFLSTPSLIHAESKSRKLEETAQYAVSLFIGFRCDQITVKENAVGYTDFVQILKKGRHSFSFIEGSYQDLMGDEFTTSVSDEEISKLLFE